MDNLNDLIHQKCEAILVSDCEYTTNCILCNEVIHVSLHDSKFKVCERCKKAWRKMRAFIENSPDYATGVRHVGRETIAKAPNYLHRG